MTDLITTPGPTANALIDVAYADAYHITRLHNEAWVKADSNDKRNAIVWATRMFETLKWFGVKTLSTNRISHPRTGTYDKDGNLVDPDFTPYEVKDACSELCFQLVEDGVDTDSDLKRIKVGPITIDFDSANEEETTNGVPANVMQMIDVYVNTAPSMLLRS